MWERLGLRSFILFLVKGILPGLLLFIVGFGILILKNYLPLAAGSAAIGGADISTLIVTAAGFLVVAGFPLMGLGIVVNAIRFWSFRYRLDEDVLRFHRGIVSVDEVSIPYVKIENVDLDQSVIGRIFGIAELYVITSGVEEKDQHAETEATFHVIDVGKARDLQKTLMARGAVQKVKAV